MVKNIGNKVLGFFLSLKTTVVLMLGLLMFFVAGALIMPVHSAFESITWVPLFEWLSEAPLSASWWLLGSLALLVALVLNTLACSIDSLIKKRSGRQWLLVIAPQIIHIGFLLMLVGHLVSGLSGYKEMFPFQEGTMVRMPGNIILKVSQIDVTLTKEGYPIDWRAAVDYIDNGKLVKSDYMAPNRPSFFRGYGAYLKQVRPYPIKAALVEITREPGAPWALGGGVVFMIGTIVLVGLKMSREQ